MAERDPGRVERLYDEMLKEDEGAREKSAAPVLPRLRLTLPSAAAPLTIRRKAATAVPPPAAQLLPEIMRQAEEARRVRAAARSKAQAAAAQGAEAPASAPAPPPSDLPSAPLPTAVSAPAGAPLPGAPGAGSGAAPARGPQAFSRVAWRYALVFGKRGGREFKGHQRAVPGEGGEAKVLFPDHGRVGRRVPSWFIERPAVTAWLFLAPALACFLLFSWMPLARGFISSFQKVSLAGNSAWVGLDHYVRAAQDPQVLATFLHALAFCALSLALGFWLPLALALYTNELRRFQGLLKLGFFLPFLTPAVPAVLMWRWILDQGYGLLNSVLSMAGLSDPHVPWLNTPALAMLSLVVVFLWKNTGWNALIYLTSMRDIPEELYETAELDGAPLWQRVRHVSLPFLRPTMAFLLLMQVISTLQIFTEVYLLTDGGPANSTEMIATYMYKRSFLYLDIGYAAALGVMLFLAMLGFTAARLRAMEES